MTTTADSTTVRETTTRRATGLRFPKLFALIGLIFLVDLVVPDFVPFADEIILGLMTVVLGLMREKRKPPRAERVD